MLQMDCCVVGPGQDRHCGGDRSKRSALGMECGAGRRGSVPGSRAAGPGSSTSRERSTVHTTADTSQYRMVGSTFLHLALSLNPDCSA